MGQLGKEIRQKLWFMKSTQHGRVDEFFMAVASRGMEVQFNRH